MRHRKTGQVNRRRFLLSGLVAFGGVPLSLELAPKALVAAQIQPSASPVGPAQSTARVALVSCKSYGPEVRAALDKSFDLLGGIGSLVKGKTVAVKLNLTGTNFSPFRNRPVGETYMTHPATAMALASALFAVGAARIRFLESTSSRATLEASLALGDWDVNALSALGKVEFENTRNLGKGKAYANLRVPGAGYMFSSFDVNHSYVDTDVMVSLAKLKNHTAAGVTLSMKNLFGITPNSIYGDESGNEEATSGRGPLHGSWFRGKVKLAGLKEGIDSRDQTWRVPRIVADVCAARPIHLAVVDGITSMSGGEGPWSGNYHELKLTSPGVLIVGLNPVSTDAVATAVMGYGNPRAVRGTKPFQICDNHLLLAEQAGLGTADLARIEVRGISIEKARYSYG